MNALSIAYDLGMIILCVVVYGVIIEDSQALAAVAAFVAIGHFFHFIAVLIDFGMARVR